MQNCAIIAEYNPFHKGHEFHIQKAKELTGADFVTVILSGSFVQRAEPAMFSKEARVKMALACGADIVLELPHTNVLQSAERYAYGAVSLANAIGADYLAFGSECGDIEKIIKAADIVSGEDIKSVLGKFLQEGMSFPAARERAVGELYPEIANILSLPNNILGIEYVKALNTFSSSMKPVTFTRVGAGHDSDTLQNGSASASKIRELLKNNEPITGLVPKSAEEIITEEIRNGRCIIDKAMFERALLAHLRGQTPKKLSTVADCTEGIEYKIIDALDKGKNIEEIILSAKSKRYTHSRLRRIILSSYLGVTEDIFGAVPYIRLLGMKKDASKLWGIIKDNCKLPVIERVAKQMDKLSRSAADILKREINADEIWGSFSQEIQPYGNDYRKFPIVF